MLINRVPIYIFGIIGHHVLMQCSSFMEVRSLFFLRSVRIHRGLPFFSSRSRMATKVAGQKGPRVIDGVHACHFLLLQQGGSERCKFHTRVGDLGLKEVVEIPKEPFHMKCGQYN